MTPKTPYFSMRLDAWTGSTKALQGHIAIELHDADKMTTFRSTIWTE